MNMENNQIFIASKRGGSSPIGYRRIDVTSHARDIFRTCSPFFAGPVGLYGDFIAKNVENGYQYSKVYSRFIGKDGNPTPEYFEWAKQGWDDAVAHRRPFGHIEPKYSWWDGEKLDYIQARKKIYIPLYSKAVVKTEGFQELERLYAAGEKLCLLDYDSFDYQALGYGMKEIINDTEHSMGHAFVLKFLLEGSLKTPHPFRVIIAGGRDFDDYPMLCEFSDKVLRRKVVDGIEIVCGLAKGADTLGERYAKERGYPIKYFPANWKLYGGQAGYIRNKQMGDYADALIAFWDGCSHGTKHMIEYMVQHNKPYRIQVYGGTEK